MPAAALPGPAADELHQPLCRPAAAADRARRTCASMPSSTACRGRASGSRSWPRDLDLEAFLDRPFGRLSAGQKTRVLLAKALINEPELLLLDEPTASLDPDTADQLRGYLEPYQARTRGHRAAGLAQHGRGRAPGAPRADAAARAAWSTRAARPSCSPATAATTSRRSSSTSPATAAGPRAAPHDAPGPAAAAAPHPRHAAAPRLPAARLLAAPARPDLLADGADDPVGLHHPVPGRPVRLGRPGRRRVPLGRPALGHAVPRPARRLDVLPRGDVRAPSGPSVRQPAAAARAGDRQLPGQRSCAS